MNGKYDQNSFSVVDHSILGQPPRRIDKQSIIRYTKQETRGN